MRYGSDREGHGNGCILGVCRGESQAKICKRVYAMWPKINMLLTPWTFASQLQGSRILERPSRRQGAENAHARGSLVRWFAVRDRRLRRFTERKVVATQTARASACGPSEARKPPSESAWGWGPTRSEKSRHVARQL